MDRAALADEAGAELLQDAVDVEQHAPEAPRIVGVIGMVDPVLAEPDSPCDLAWQFVDLDPDPELCERRHHQRVELRHRPRSEEHTSELQSRLHIVCRLLLEKKKQTLK